MKGILFTQDNIRAVMEGRKTQTRRLQGLDEVNKSPNDWSCRFIGGFAFFVSNYERGDGNIISVSHPKIKPRYLPGEIVYVKESHQYLTAQAPNDFGIGYPIDGEIRYWRDNGGMMDYPIDSKLRSPMFLKEIFARTFLLVKDVKSERLQNITGLDCEAEGIKDPSRIGDQIKTSTAWDEYMRCQYQRLWDSINAKPRKILPEKYKITVLDNTWASNPWVWAYKFEVVKK